MIQAALLILIYISASHAYAWKGYQLTPAVGSGSSSLNMTVNSDLNYSSTNQSFSFVSLNVDDFSAQVKFPLKDSEQSRAERVDSKVTDYQFGFKINKNLRTLFYYQNYQGYYVEKENIGFRNSDLSFSHLGGQLIYAFNSEFSTAMLEDAAWSQEKDHGSWIGSMGIDRFEIKGRLIPEPLDPNHFGLQNAKIDSLSLRVGYGYNWLWSHWFTGAAFGLGTNINKSSAVYEVPEEEVKTAHLDAKFISNFSFAGGYRWTRTKLGIFARQFNWNLSFDGVDINSNTSMTGIYLSSVF